LYYFRASFEFENGKLLSNQWNIRITNISKIFVSTRGIFRVLLNLRPWILL